MDKQDIAELFDAALYNLDDEPEDCEVLGVSTMIMTSVIIGIIEKESYQEAVDKMSEIIMMGLKEWTGSASYMN